MVIRGEHKIEKNCTFNPNGLLQAKISTYAAFDDLPAEAAQQLFRWPTIAVSFVVLLFYRRPRPLFCSPFSSPSPVLLLLLSFNNNNYKLIRARPISQAKGLSLQFLGFSLSVCLKN